MEPPSDGKSAKRVKHTWMGAVGFVTPIPTYVSFFAPPLDMGDVPPRDVESSVLKRAREIHPAEVVRRLDLCERFYSHDVKYLVYVLSPCEDPILELLFDMFIERGDLTHVQYLPDGSRAMPHQHARAALLSVVESLSGRRTAFSTPVQDDIIVETGEGDGANNGFLLI